MGGGGELDMNNSFYGASGGSTEVNVSLSMGGFEDMDAFAFPRPGPLSVPTTGSSPDFQEAPSTSASTSPPSKPKPRAKTPKIKDVALNVEGDPKVKKRTLNTLAARRYRQKRLDQMEELEIELQEVRAERDAFKVRCARLEGEVGVLRGLVGK